MNGKCFQPQMTQMNADVFLKFSICANLHNLRLKKSPARDLSAEARRAKEETDKALKAILEKLGV